MSAQHDELRIGSLTFYGGSSRTQSDWENAIRELLTKGEPFQAYDLASIALIQFPDSLILKQLTALALIRTGSIERAKNILEPLCLGFVLDEEKLTNLYSQLYKILELLQTKKPRELTEKDKREILHSSLIVINTSCGDFARPGDLNEETAGLMARIYKDVWKRTGDLKDARFSRDIYLQYFFLDTASYWCGINAAAMSLAVGEQGQAIELARQVLKLCKAQLKSAAENEKYWLTATLAEALLISGQKDLVEKTYKTAFDLARGDWDKISSSIQQLKLLITNKLLSPELLKVAHNVIQICKTPSVVFFTGHMIDHPLRGTTRFPFYLEDVVRRALDAQLNTIDARIGFSSAACGSDILFIEAMWDRGAEINILLPFDVDDFIGTSVIHAGEQWVTRFNRALKLADSVQYVTKENFLGDDTLFDYANQVIKGYAQLRANHLQTTPYLVTVLEPQTKRLKGGTAQVVDLWPDKDKLRIINLKQLRENTPDQTHTLSPSPCPRKNKFKHIRKSFSYHNRNIFTMLFADIVGYSKLNELDYPAFHQLLVQVAASLKTLQVQPSSLNTWGDAIFVTMVRARSLLEYAFQLQNAICNTDCKKLGLPIQMNVRIALHAGPAFEITDPLTGMKNLYGSHVNRAARLEPVTVPGQIYACDQFVAQLVSEQVEYEYQAQQRGTKAVCDFALEYVGNMELHKGFGLQRVYHIRKRTPHEQRILPLQFT